MGIRDTPFDLTDLERKFNPAPIDAEAFKFGLTSFREALIGHLTRAYLCQRTPAAFRDSPMGWEAIRKFTASRITNQTGIATRPAEIGLTGSAALGFSAAPTKYGKHFGDTSDLDLYIINTHLFEGLRTEFLKFQAQTGYEPQKKTLATQFPRGLVDTKNFPANHDRFPIAASLLNEASIIVAKLSIEAIPVKRSHFRVYKNWETLHSQLETNLRLLRTTLSESTQ